MEDDNNFGFTRKNNRGQKQRTVRIPSEALDNLEALDLEGVLNTSETELSLGRNSSEALDNLEALDLEGILNTSETELSLGRNSRCVSVDTILPAPLGRRKKRVFKGKGDLVKFRCTVYEKKLLMVKAKITGLSLSEYVRRTVFEQTVTERFTEEHIELYKMLLKYHNNFKSIGNMFKKRNPALTEKVYELADDIKAHLKKFQE